MKIHYIIPILLIYWSCTHQNQAISKSKEEQGLLSYIRHSEEFKLPPNQLGGSGDWGKEDPLSLEDNDITLNPFSNHTDDITTMQPSYFSTKVGEDQFYLGVKKVKQKPAMPIKSPENLDPEILILRK